MAKLTLLIQDGLGLPTVSRVATLGLTHTNVMSTTAVTKSVVVSKRERAVSKVDLYK